VPPVFHMGHSPVEDFAEAYAYTVAIASVKRESSRLRKPGMFHGAVCKNLVP
jgi:hypothetical protein